MTRKSFWNSVVAVCSMALATPVFARDAKYDVAALIEPKLATPLLDIERAQVSGTNIVVGSTPVSGVCTNGFNLYNNNGVVGCQASGGGAVSSVSNSDGTLTISPTTGAVVASIALGHANTWSGQQTFVSPILGTPASGNGANLTGLVYTALPALSANQVLGALTATTPSGQSVPSCSAAASALTWTSGTGFGCNTIGGTTPTNVIAFGVLAKVNSAVVFAGATGAGYVTNDTITVATTGGTCSIAPVLTVTASAGAITSLAVQTAGSCTAIPANNPATQGTTSGSGTNGKFVLTWGTLVQVYTPTTGMKLVKVCALGGGAGGGSGSIQAASTASSGGAGGGGGATFVNEFTAAQIGGSANVGIGIGSNGGTPPTATAAGGNGVTPTVATTFGTTLLVVPFPGGGAGGQLGAVTSGGGGGAGYTSGVSSTTATGGLAGGGGTAGGTGVAAASIVNLFAGAGGGGTSAAGVAAIGGWGAGGGPGGGSGGGLTSGSGTNVGAAGGNQNAAGFSITAGSIGGINTNGGNGVNQTNLSCDAMAGSSGGGGGSGAATTTAGNGGLGGSGSGGGGGGSVVTGAGSLAGWGGRGGDGYMFVIEYF